ncbi:hypothetical protein RFI_04891 [Reticulomyxa filosa]|uniref:Uncharacterized protein n=1 Tax=Reticulomyxa filosa TaxID=46433 RepID=X6P1X2_RETFI|nr:hypothetical protein RFI_04891 [Reticulomyxa filosa]|eukprot:ETO32226.1 hypothetical protein RFI_04891 [Reticulomyxa filosa]
MKYILVQTFEHYGKKNCISFVLDVVIYNGELESKADLVIRALTNNKKAGKLTFSMLPIQSKDFLTIAKYLQQRLKKKKNENLDQSIERLNLTGVPINPGLMQVIADELLDNAKYGKLKWLNLSQTGLTGDIPVTKAKSIPKQPQMREPNKSDNEKEGKTNKKEDVISILSKGLEKNTSLTYLHLSKNPKIKSDAFNRLLQSMYKHPQIHLLIYNGNRLTFEHAVVLGHYFAQFPNPTLTRISLEGCSINDQLDFFF